MRARAQRAGTGSRHCDPRAQLPGTIGLVVNARRTGGSFVRTPAIGPFAVDAVAAGDCRKLLLDLPDESVDVIVTSPPYWGQRISEANGVEADPRSYLTELTDIFAALLPKLKPAGILWINLGDAYN